jgi:protoheme IX farnesyltransferase
VSAANALNMYWERDVDAHMTRTRGRPLPQGRLAPELALAVGVTLACASVPAMALGGNGITALLGLLAFGLYVFAYTPLKRLSPLSLFVGAVPGALPPLMGWTAATGRMDPPGLALFAILFLWQVPHFLAIAVRRGDEYQRAGFAVYTLARHPIELRLHVVVGAALLLVASLSLAPLGVAGWTYEAAALVAGLAFLAPAVQAVVGRVPPARWARSLFLISLAYLPALFGAVVIDRLLAAWLR